MPSDRLFIDKASTRHVSAELSADGYRPDARYAMHDRLQIQFVRMTESPDHDWSYLLAPATSRFRGFGHTWNMSTRMAVLVRLDGGDG